MTPHHPQQDYGARIYDDRIGRFLSIDPITSSYPELTPYQFASNRPIMAIDIDSLVKEKEAFIATQSNTKYVKTMDRIAKKINPYGLYCDN
jgi:uncharacterized protein RhaS with RHS repeats